MDTPQVVEITMACHECGGTQFSRTPRISDLLIIGWGMMGLVLVSAPLLGAGLWLEVPALTLVALLTGAWFLLAPAVGGNYYWGSVRCLECGHCEQYR